jgi:chromosome segregation ATPase
MTNIAMMEQSRTKDDSDCEWGPISLDYTQFTKPPQTPSDISSVSGIADLELLMSENEALEDERFNLQETVLERDDSICDLHRRMSCLQHQVDKLSRANNMIACQLEETQRVNEENEKLKERLDYCTKNANYLSNNLQKTESHMKELRSEINCIKKDKEFLNEFGAGGSQQQNCTDDDSKNDKVKCLQDQYEQLLQEYCKKDNEHKEMTCRLKKCLKNNESELEKVENEALKKESEKLISEIEDYRILIKELQTQIDLYRDKFMKAQEKVETQKLRIEKLECSKNSIEFQVNEEIERIKEKFQEKLNELCPYPEKYAESRNELQKSKARIVVLESNLKDITNELWKAKCELKTLKEQPNDSIVEKYEKLQIAMEEEQKKYCVLKKTKECLEDKLCSIKQELEDLRRDSAKIITTSKCTAEKNRQILHEQINCLEFELAQCRATASLSLTEKEELIKQLQQELNSLCGHFNGCQGQIMQLKDQIEYLTNQRYKESDKNLDCYELFSNK